ncbi:MAG: Aspartokinase [Sclerophora amabilis]|nr:MAG: Aspartokinase [Sclerophora amabilis]
MGSDGLINGHDRGPQLLSAPQAENEDSRSWIVQKFGGTSLGKFAINVAEDIVKYVKLARLQDVITDQSCLPNRPSLADHRIAVVCSARSSHTKAEGTTNRLLRAARAAEKPNSNQHQAIVDAICDDHISAVNHHIGSPEIVANVTADIRRECADLSAFLEATQRVGEISPRSEDKVISKGEKLSCLFVAALLQDREVESEYVDLSEIVTFDVQHGLDLQFYHKLASSLARLIFSRGNKVPVITGKKRPAPVYDGMVPKCLSGYFGSVPGGILDKVGRGYTDLCAALVAVGLHAEELQVWKEVDGIFTADPRKVPTARLLPTITPAEAAELTFYGSEVIHPFTMEQVIQARIPIRIKNVMNPRGNGTVILPDKLSELDTGRRGLDLSLTRTRSSSILSEHRPKRPTAVTIKRQILVINVHSNKRSLSHGFFAKIFSTLHKWRLSVDLISTSEVHVSMALHSESAFLSGWGDDALELLDKDLGGAIMELQDYGTVDIIPNMAILSLVGRQMRNMIGIAGRMFSTLGENNVNIEMISQGKRSLDAF